MIAHTTILTTEASFLSLFLTFYLGINDHTTFIHDWIQAHLAPNTLPAIDISFPVNVNMTGVCNAYYNFSSINFYSSGNGCPNMAYDTVIYHEYGHFVDYKIGGITNGGLSEGWGDTLAAFATGQPLIGEGFYQDGRSVRRADNTYQYPSAGNDEVHNLGQAWVGFAWDLRKNLIASLGETEGIKTAENLIIPTLYANSKDIPTAVYDVIIRDDNDGDFNNYTPHYNEIADAANKHSLPLPEKDYTNPDPINDLHIISQSATNIVLGWTASGDDGKVGTATSYDIRYSFSPIKTNDEFAAAIPLTNTIIPLPSGQAEKFTFKNPAINITYYIAIKVLDNMRNASDISNIVSPMVKAKIIYSENFESQPAVLSSSGLWHLTTNRSNSPTHSFAYNNGTNYDTDIPNSGSLTLSPITVPTTAAEIIVSFQQWVNTDPSPYFDLRFLEISDNDQASWITIPLNYKTEQKKWLVENNAFTGFSGKKINIRFRFNTVDQNKNDFEGWYVDDVKVYITEPPVINPIGSQLVKPGELLEFNVSATDPNNGPLTYTAKGLPFGAAFANQTFHWTPNGSQVGKYSVEFIVSNGNLSKSETVVINVTNSLADLAMTAIASNWPSIAPGNYLSASYIVNNIGTGAADASTIVVHLSKDANYGGDDDLLIMSGGVLPVAANKSLVELNMPLSIPANVSPGNYYLCARIDDTNVIDEMNENNNTNCSITPVLIAAGDLAMSSMTGPGTVTPGVAFNVTSTIKNQGRGALTNVAVEFYASLDPVITTSDTYIGVRYINVLFADSSITSSSTVNIPRNISSGTYYLGAIADPSNNIAETDETNNIAIAPQTVVINATGVDFVMTALKGPGSIFSGDNVSLDFSIKNQGSVKSTKTTITFVLSTDSQITVDDTFLSSLQDVPELSAGESYSGSFKFNLPHSIKPGNYYWGAIANLSVSTQTETNNNNNALAGNSVIISAIAAPTLNTAVAGSGEVTLGWNSVAGATDYVIKYGTLSGVYPQAVSAGNVTTYTLTNLKNNVPYYFVVVAKNSVGSSVDSNEKSATPQDLVADAKQLIDDYFIQIAMGNDTSVINGKLKAAMEALTNPADKIAVADYYNTAALKTVKDAVDEYFGALSAGQNTDSMKNILSNAMSVVLKPPDLTTANDYYNATALATAKTAVDNLIITILEEKNTDQTQSILSTAMSAIVKPADKDAALDYYNSSLVKTIKPVISTATAGDSQIILNWSSVASATSYIIKYGTESGTYSTTLEAGNVTAYTVTNLKNDTTYYCIVIAKNALGLSKSSKEVILTPKKPTADLLVSTMTAPSSGSVGSQVTITDTVINQGTGAAGGFFVGYYLSKDPVITRADTVLYYRYVTSLGVNSESKGNITVTIPNFSPGTYYWGIIVDPFNQQTEFNKTNNAITGETIVVSPSTTDLIMSSMSGPASVQAGSAITLTDTVKNQGIGAAGGFYVSYYLSKDPVITTTDTLITYRYVTSLGANASNTGSISATIPNIAPGTYYWGAIADPFNQQLELNENNNTLTANTTTVSSSSTDLVMDSMTAPSTGKVGSQVMIKDTVINQGTSNSGGFYVAYYLSNDPVITTTDTLLGYRHVPSLGAGLSNKGNVTVTIPNLKSGTYYWGAIADAFNQQAEMNENNNTLTINTITIEPTTADLVMTAMSGPTSGKVGSAVTITDTVKNQGTSAIGGFYVAYYLSKDPVITTSDTMLYYRYVPPLGANSNNSGSVTYKIPNLAPGIYYWGAIADAFNQQAESNKTNNAITANTLEIKL